MIPANAGYVQYRAPLETSQMPSISSGTMSCLTKTVTVAEAAAAAAVSVGGGAEEKGGEGELSDASEG
jgi:hypothetical protein